MAFANCFQYGRQVASKGQALAPKPAAHYSHTTARARLTFNPARYKAADNDNLYKSLHPYAPYEPHKTWLARDE